MRVGVGEGVIRLDKKVFLVLLCSLQKVKFPEKSLDLFWFKEKIYCLCFSLSSLTTHLPKWYLVLLSLKARSSPRRHANGLIVLFILPLTIPVALFALRVELFSSVLAFPLVLNGS